MKIKLPWVKKVMPEPCPPGSLGDTMQLDPTKDVYIKTGSGSFDGVHTFTGWPLEKTNVARKPSKSKGEIACRECEGDGWDANSGGETYICPNCKGTGVEDGNAICVCGHKRYEHYLDSTCEADYLDLYGSYYRKDGSNPLIHPLRDKEYNINNRPCKCGSFRDRSKPSYENTSSSK